MQWYNPSRAITNSVAPCVSKRSTHFWRKAVKISVYLSAVCSQNKTEIDVSYNLSQCIGLFSCTQRTTEGVSSWCRVLIIHSFHDLFIPQVIHHHIFTSTPPCLVFFLTSFLLPLCKSTHLSRVLFKVWRFPLDVFSLWRSIPEVCMRQPSHSLLAKTESRAHTTQWGWRWNEMSIDQNFHLQRAIDFCTNWTAVFNLDYLAQLLQPNKLH